MKWIVAVLLCLIVILGVLGMIGSNVVALPKTHDPFPPAVRTQIDILNDERLDIERLAGKAKMFGKEADLSKERQEYDELALEADAWLKNAKDGLALHSVDAPFLSQKFEERLLPKAKDLAAKLKAKQPAELGVADFDHLISAVEKGWNDFISYFKLVRAADADSIRIAINQLDEMRWPTWLELKSTLL